jgi:hypothetical protein
MKKGLLAAIAIGVLPAACDNSDLGWLQILNTTPNQVTSVTLSGPEDTGNLLDAPIEASEGTTTEDVIAPGTYTWRIEYGGGAGLATYYDSADWGIEIEVFPGRNTLRLQESAGGL